MSAEPSPAAQAVIDALPPLPPVTAQHLVAITATATQAADAAA